jgi:hypothetical protein
VSLRAAAAPPPAAFVLHAEARLLLLAVFAPLAGNINGAWMILCAAAAPAPFALVGVPEVGLLLPAVFAFLSANMPRSYARIHRHSRFCNEKKSMSTW